MLRFDKLKTSKKCGDFSGDFNNWGVDDADCQMVYSGDGIYTLYVWMMEGNHSLKVTCGNWDNFWGGDGKDGNYVFHLATEGYVTVSFDAATGIITVTGNSVGAFQPELIVIDYLAVVGDEGLTGCIWDLEQNKMTCVNGVYTITFNDVAEGCHQFKFAANGTWEHSWASGIEIVSGETQTAWYYPSGNSSVTVPDGADVTFIFDTTAMDFVTGEGATMTVTVKVPDPTKVEGVAVSNVGRTGFNVSWDAIEGATRYWVYLNGKLHNSTAGNSLTVANRQMETLYQISVTALLADGTILSLEDADIVSVTTLGYEFASSFTSAWNSITLDWAVEGCTRTWFYVGTDPDNLKIKGSSTDSSYTITGLEPETTYYVELEHFIDNKAVRTGEILEITTGINEAIQAEYSIHDDTAEFNWNAVGDSWKYWVIVDNGERTYTYATTDTHYTLTGFDMDVCTVTLKGVNSDGVYAYELNLV